MYFFFVIISCPPPLLRWSVCWIPISIRTTYSEPRRRPTTSPATATTRRWRPAEASSTQPFTCTTKWNSFFSLDKSRIFRMILWNSYRPLRLPSTQSYLIFFFNTKFCCWILWGFILLYELSLDFVAFQWFRGISLHSITQLDTEVFFYRVLRKFLSILIGFIFYLSQPLILQAYRCVESAGPGGLKQKDLAVQLAVNQLDARTLLRALVRLQLVDSVVKDQAKNRVYVSVGPFFFNPHRGGNKLFSAPLISFSTQQSQLKLDFLDEFYSTFLFFLFSFFFLSFADLFFKKRFLWKADVILLVNDLRLQFLFQAKNFDRNVNSTLIFFLAFVNIKNVYIHTTFFNPDIFTILSVATWCIVLLHEKNGSRF